MKNNNNKIFNFIKSNLLIVFFLPVIINTLLNIFDKANLKILNDLNFAKFGSFILGTLFFIYLSNFLDNQYLLGGKSIGLVLFLTSYFIFDTVLLFISKNFNFKFTVMFVSLLWCVLIIYKTKSVVEITKILLLFFIYRIFNYLFFAEIANNSTYQELNTDVPAQWFGIASMIFEKNYFYALENNLIEGQGLLPSYIQALILEIGFNIENFQFIQINSYLFLTFTVLLISDLKISKKNKIASSIFLIAIMINNDWLEYLMLNSLMIEGIVSFLISVYLYNFIQMYKRNDIKSFLFFVSFGGMVLTKNFISIISLMLIISSVFLLRKNIFLLGSFVIYGFNLFYQKIYFSQLQSVAYTSEIDFKDLLLDFIYLRDLNFSNIRNIFEQFLIDKPTTYVVLGFFILNVVSLFKYKLNLQTDELLFFVVLLNYILVNLLYISYWRNIEFESSYRYIFSCFHLIFLSLISRFSKFENTK
tara:strand:+ start:644 stop:2065 length:1422 start_codon:yes stop_codon:yes gene_type:complete